MEQKTGIGSLYAEFSRGYEARIGLFRPEVRPISTHKQFSATKGVAVKMPRFRIAGMMAFVAIAALDFAAIQALLARHGNALDDQRNMCLLLGALPMTNVLAVGMLIGQRRPASRPFLLGFEAFGATALVLFVALAICFPREVVLPYLTPVLVLKDRTIGNDRPFVMIPVVVVALLGWPQVAFALAGGFLSRRFKVTISPRP